ncbi:hypothetical protein DYQ86_25455 [Acidobacteria bacterium AB60]|nr:hypothetical protein DYQ86_25455 [Acidobacteria bacterium AB60]
MKRTVLLGYQSIAGLSDTATGAMLCVAPQFTLRLMGVSAPAAADPYLSWIGAFVFAVGIAYLYGAMLIALDAPAERIEIVWLLTAMIRSAVAIYVLKAILADQLSSGWMTVAIFDGVCALIQAIGLRKRWLSDVR